MFPKGSLAEQFSSIVSAGMLETTPYAKHFTTLEKSSWHFAPAGKPADLFGGLLQLVKEVDAYRGPAIKKGKLLPMDELVCIEDDISLVLLKNNPCERHGVIVADYRDFGKTSYIMAAALALVPERKERDMFKVSSLYLGHILEKSVKPIVEPETLLAIEIDLVASTITAIEQLALLYGCKPN